VCRVVAGVVGQADRRRVREARDEVLAPDRRRVHLQVTRRLLDDAFDDVGRLGAAGAAVRVDRRSVREHRLHLGVDRGRLVLAGQQGRVQDGRHARREGRQVGAHVRDRLHAQREEVALRVGRELGGGHVVAAVRIGQERLAAFGRPLDRPADALARPDERGLFRVQEDLRAEAAADIGRDHAHLRLGQPEHERAHQQPLDVRVLVRDVQGVALVVLRVARVRGARLHRVRDQPVVDDVELADVGRALERRVDRVLVAMAPVVADIARHVVVHRCGGTVGLRDVDDGGQFFVVDLDQLGRVLRLVDALGDDQRHLVAHVAHLALREHRVRRLLHRRAVLAVDQPAARQPADLRVGEVGAGEDHHDARRGLGLVELDGLDARVRVR
jgi:hypothetical protein